MAVSSATFVNRESLLVTRCSLLVLLRADTTDHYLRIRPERENKLFEYRVVDVGPSHHFDMEYDV